MPLSEKHMDLFTETELAALLAPREHPCISIYMPTQMKGAETQQNCIRAKNLLRDVEHELAASGMRESEIKNLLALGHELLDETAFWQYQSRGLALFFAREDAYRFRLPIPFEKMHVIDRRFHVAPLLPAIPSGERFHILALAQNGVRFLEGTRYTVRQVPLEKVPTSLAETLRHVEFERNAQSHTGAAPGGSATGRRATFHGQGASADEDNEKQNIRNFFHQLDRGVHEYLGEGSTPLVLAGVEFIRALYREANHYPHMQGEGIDKSPNDLSDAELQRQAWEIVAPVFRKAEKTAEERFHQFRGSGNERAVDDVRAIVPAACYKQIETLFASNVELFWGRFHSDSGEVEVHETKQPGDEELINLAAVSTLQNRGTVYSMDPSELPGESPVSAILRFAEGAGNS